MLCIREENANIQIYKADSEQNKHVPDSLESTEVVGSQSKLPGHPCRGHGHCAAHVRCLNPQIVAAELLERAGVGVYPDVKRFTGEKGQRYRDAIELLLLCGSTTDRLA